MNISIILITTSPKNLSHALDYYWRQCYDGIKVELVIVQSINKTSSDFSVVEMPPMAKIRKIEKRNDVSYYDNAALARDYGLKESCGDYVVFWDDDNIYQDHYISTMYSTALGNDVAIARIRHSGHIIGESTDPGNIDTMCFCVKREIAVKNQWYDGGGGYNDYRWISRCLEDCESVKYSPMIVGSHL